MIAALVLASALVLGSAAWAHEGDSHGDAPAAATGQGPQRLPDGSVFLPKPAQRQLAVRTRLTREAELARTVELAGKVVMDPNAGGLVQASSAGRIAAGPHGLPLVGQAVRRGQVLAYVLPSAAPIERANQAAQLAELRAARGLAEKRLARLQLLADTVPRKEIETAQAELHGLAARADAVAGGLAAREPLVAPVAGVIAAANVVAGQIVDARERVFDIVDPQRLGVVALAFDAALASDIGGASLAVGGQQVPLQFTGSARSLREQALPLHFKAEGAALSALALNQPVRVFVRSRSTVRGVAVPAASLMKNPSNQTIVWVKTAPERFEPRVVTTEPLDGVDVAVTSGLAAGERVATVGATLINQIR